MNNPNISDIPEIYPKIEYKCKEIGFTMPSDIHIGSLLKTLITSKPKSNILEVGTGIGLSLAWMIDGLDNNSKLTTIDNDPQLTEIAKHFFDADSRVEILCTDGSDWIKNYSGTPFDLIFADTWPGKYNTLEETLELVKVGGYYIIDDMIPQPNWPEGHEIKAKKLVAYLEGRKDFSITKINWSTGIILCSKKY